jgi:hypothetical protein
MLAHCQHSSVHGEDVNGGHQVVSCCCDGYGGWVEQWPSSHVAEHHRPPPTTTRRRTRHRYLQHGWLPLRRSLQCSPPMTTRRRCQHRILQRDRLPLRKSHQCSALLLLLHAVGDKVGTRSACHGPRGGRRCLLGGRLCTSRKHLCQSCLRVVIEVGVEVFSVHHGWARVIRGMWEAAQLRRRRSRLGVGGWRRGEAAQLRRRHN